MIGFCDQTVFMMGHIGDEPHSHVISKQLYREPFVRYAVGSMAAGFEPSHTPDGIKTLPSNKRRAVRKSAARLILGRPPPSSISISTENSPVGCSTDISFASPSGITATLFATVPGITQPVPTDTAANTPMAA